MFFGQDVLFHDGPLALLWMAGNGRLSLKNTADARKRDYRRILEANIPELCDILRKYFPQMGTAHGMSLKQAMTLVKGINFVFCYKMNFLAKQIFMDAMKIHMNNIARLKQIDLEPQTVKPRTKQRAIENDPAAEKGIMNEYGNLHNVSFEMLDAEDLEPRRFANNATITPPGTPAPFPGPVQGSPAQKTRRQKKRKAEDTQLGTEEVMEKLRNATKNPDANLMAEMPDLNLATQFPEFGFDDGTHFIAPEIDNTGTRPELPIPPGLRSPEGRPSTDTPHDPHPRMRPIRPRLEEEEGQEIPAFADQQQPDVDAMELQSLEDVQVEGRTSRRVRMRLAIDGEHQIPMDDIHDQLNAQKRPLDYDELREIARLRMHAGKEARGMMKINQVGRRLIGSGLRELTNDQKEACKRQPHETDETTDQNLTPPGRGGRGNGERLRENFTLGLQQQSTVGPHAVPVNTAMQSPIRDTFFPPPQDANEIPLLPEDDQPPIEQVPFFNEEETPMPRTGDENEEQQIISSMERGASIKFRDLFPPRTVNRRQAAKGFLSLLKLQSVGKVSLKQDAPFGDIVITKV